MGSILYNIFGKSNNITKDDLDLYLLQNKYHENNIFEAKTIFKDLYEYTYKDQQNKKFAEYPILETHILKPIISFLNSIDGEGLLALGIKTEMQTSTCIKIEGIDSKVINNEQQLKSLILTNLGYIGKKQEPNIEIKSIIYTENNDIFNEKNETSKKQIFLIEVNRINYKDIFYSKISNLIYIRRNDSSYKLDLTLPEAIEFIEKKRCAQIFVNFKKIKETDNSVEFYITWTNKGNKPGFYVWSQIKCSSNDFGKNTSTFLLQGSTIQSTNNINPDLNKDIHKTYNATGGYPPSTILIYPNNNLYIGSIIIEYLQSFEINIKIETYEEKSYSHQIITLSKEPNKDVEIIYDKTEWEPYLI